MPSPSNPTEPARPASSSLIPFLLLGLAAIWCLYWFVHAWNYWEDDAYIHLEFARSLAAGQGFAFNGRVVAGDTAPLWVFLLAAVHTAIPNWLIAGKVLTALATLFGLAGASDFTRRLAGTLAPSAAAWLPAALVLLIAANPCFCYWAFSGMEPIAAAGVAFYAVLAATPATPSTRGLLTACLLAGLGPLLRPEMIFLTGLLTLPLLAQWSRLAAAKSASFTAGLLLLCAPVALWSLYSLHAFGHLVPNTNAAKRASPQDSVVLHLLTTYALAFPIVLIGLLGAIVHLVRHPSATRSSIQRAIPSAAPPPGPSVTSPKSPSLPLAGWIFVLWPSITTVFYIANHTYVQTRYILATAPALTVVIVLLALSVSHRLGVAVYSAALAAALVVSLVSVRPFVRNKAFNCVVVDDLGLFLRDHVSPDAPVAVYSIGQIAFVSQHPIVDISGITRPGALPYLNQSPAAMLRWARSQGAQYFIGEKPEPAAVLVYTGPQRFIGWSLRSAPYSILNRIELWKLTPSTSPPDAAEAAPAAIHR